MPAPCSASSACRASQTSSHSVPSGSRAREHRGERGAGEVLHELVRPAIGQDAEREDVDETVVMDEVWDPRLGDEPLGDLGVGGQPARQHLDRDLRADRALHGAIDPAHRAATDHLDDPIAGDVLAGQRIVAGVRERATVARAHAGGGRDLAARRAHVSFRGEHQRRRLRGRSSWWTSSLLVSVRREMPSSFAASVWLPAARASASSIA